MTPLRLFVLAVLIYLAWRLIRGKQRQTPEAGNQGGDQEARDVLVEDPVCHVLIPKHQALRLRRDGVTYYFCSERCCDQFAGDSPEQGAQ